MRIIATAIVAALALGAATTQAATLDQVKARGHLICGINPNLPGFGAPDAQGVHQGFNADYCRAVAAAIFGAGATPRFVPLTPTNRFTALQTGEVDILAHNTTWTMSRDTAIGLRLVGAMFYDGQGFMTKKGGPASAKDLNGASVCTQQGSTTELNAADYFRAQGYKYEPVSFQSSDEATAAFAAGRCDALTSDVTALLGERRKLKSPEDFAILPEVISKEPLGPTVRRGDDQWFEIARWTMFALMNAEELGVTKANVEEMTKSANPETRRLLGVEGEFGKTLGLPADWAKAAIASVGNYGEIFERDLGAGSALKLPRGPNALWTKGGLIFAPPIR
ncbi:MAG: amino acid ABC transporter substrate-binding protein [Rhizobiales bacterium]|nr:amino acid ABC transporter substrate-binding protein [Hyphomicrobiales bacterium]